MPETTTLDRLLAAARERFARDGYAATSLDEIAADLGLTKGALYHHFSSKTELFEAVFEQIAKEHLDEIAAVVMKQTDAWSAAYAGISSYFDLTRDPGVQRIQLLDAPSVLGWERVREIEARYGLALIRAAIAGLIEAGEVDRKHDVEVLGNLFFGLLIEGTQVIARAKDQKAAQKKVEREVRAVLDGLRVS